MLGSSSTTSTEGIWSLSLMASRPLSRMRRAPACSPGDTPALATLPNAGPASGSGPADPVRRVASRVGAGQPDAGGELAGAPGEEPGALAFRSLMRTSRASLLPPETRPATNTRAPLDRAPLGAFLPCSRTLARPARSQVHVVPLGARTARWPPLADTTLPRSNASVVVPVRLW